MTYTLQDAKAKFSELVVRCLHEGPQTVTRHGKNVVVVPYEDYRRLTGPRSSLGDFFRAAPRADVYVSRSGETGREPSDTTSTEPE